MEREVGEAIFVEDASDFGSAFVSASYSPRAGASLILYICVCVGEIKANE